MYGGIFLAIVFGIICYLNRRRSQADSELAKLRRDRKRTTGLGEDDPNRSLVLAQEEQMQTRLIFVKNDAQNNEINEYEDG